MVFKIDELKDVCSNILAAVETNTFSNLGNTLELKVEGNKFIMCVTNKEYFVKVSLSLADETNNIHATVEANTFLKLISRMTTEYVELKTEDTYLIIKGNGNYKLPLIYDGESLMTLPEISIENPTTNFQLDGNILASISKFNSRQLSMGMISQPIQKLYYVDNEGALTFTTGACVNKFTLEKPVKMLLNERLVKLFNLFKADTVNFTLGQDIFGEIIQTKARFKTDNIDLTAILPGNEMMIKSVPVSIIRGRAFEDYEKTIVLNKNEVLETIDRLMLFPDIHSSRAYSKCQFGLSSVKIWDPTESNYEEIYYQNNSSITEEYEAILDLQDIRATLDSFAEKFITMGFGNNQAIVISSRNIYNVIPEVNQ